MADQDFVEVFENGWDGESSIYQLNISTESATVTVTQQGVGVDGSNNHRKRRKMDHEPNVAENNSSPSNHSIDEPTEDFGIECFEAYNDADVDEQDGNHPIDSPHSIDDLLSLADCREWSHDLGETIDIPPFMGETGLHISSEENESVLSCFKLFIDDHLLQHLQDQTNKYAEDMKAANTDKLEQGSRNLLKRWKFLTLTELKGFILVLLHMAMMKKNRIHDYWCQDIFLASPFAAQILTRDRFRAILYFFHMNDNHTYIPASQPGHDPLHQIRPVYDYLKQRFHQVYTPDKTLAIGRITHFDSSSSTDQPEMRQVELGRKSKKPNLSLYTLCESASGYVATLELRSETHATKWTKEKSRQVALCLTAPFVDKGYHIYTDHNFTSLGLFETLTKKNTLCTGAFNDDKEEIPASLVEKDVPVMGHIAVRSQDNLYAVKWKSGEGEEDSVYVLTSAHHPLLEIASKKNKNRKEVDKTMTRMLMGKPSCVTEYNKAMSSLIHLTDEITEYSHLPYTILNWPKRIFLHLLILSVKQAMVVYNKIQTEKGDRFPTLGYFIKALGKELSDEYGTERDQPAPNLVVPRLTRTPGPATGSDKLLRFDHSHFHYLVHLPPESSISAKPLKECKVCNAVHRRIRDTAPEGSILKGYRKAVNLWCAVCKVAMCVDPCFYLYHNEGDYISVGATMEHFWKQSRGKRKRVGLPAVPSENDP